MHRLVIFLVLGALLCGCGSSSAQPSPTRTAALGVKTYHDSRYGFTFSYPSIWSVPNRGGHMSTISGVPTYVVDVRTPHQAVGIQVTVDQDLKRSDYSSIPEGKVAPYGGATLHYHHVTVSSWPSIQIQRYTGSQVDGIFTIANTHRYSFQVQMITATPPFSADALTGYQTVVRTIHLPF